MPSKPVEIVEPIGVSELRELAAAGAVITPHLDARRLRRLAGLLSAMPEGVDGDFSGIEVGIGFERDGEGVAGLRIDVSGSLPLRCQRCLQAVEWPLRLSTRLTVVMDDAEAEALADPFDSAILEDGELRLETVVEDEILVALPLAPVHESGENCNSAGAPIKESENETEQTYRPFASLAGMVGGDRDEQ